MTTNEQAGGANSPATGEVLARPRELIALCAARTAELDGARADTLARNVRNSLVLHPRPQASGTALALEKGLRLELLRPTGLFLLILAGCAYLALSQPNFWVQSIFIAVLMGVALLPALYVELAWRDKLRSSSAMLPAEGTAVRVDSNCLAVGEMSVPWADVRLEAVEMGYLWRPRIFPTWRVDQLRLATGKGSRVLDVHLIKNGREVIDTICGNLPERARHWHILTGLPRVGRRD